MGSGKIVIPIFPKLLEILWTKQLIVQRIVGLIDNENNCYSCSMREFQERFKVHLKGVNNWVGTFFIL